MASCRLQYVTLEDVFGKGVKTCSLLFPAFSSHPVSMIPFHSTHLSQRPPHFPRSHHHHQARSLDSGPRYFKGREELNIACHKKCRQVIKETQSSNNGQRRKRHPARVKGALVSYPALGEQMTEKISHILKVGTRNHRELRERWRDREIEWKMPQRCRTPIHPSEEIKSKSCPVWESSSPADRQEREKIDRFGISSS